MWWYLVDGRKIGPLEQEDLAKLILDESVNGETLVWKAGMEDWLHLSAIEELSGKLREVPPPPPKPIAVPQPEEIANPAPNRYNNSNKRAETSGGAKTEIPSASDQPPPKEATEISSEDDGNKAISQGVKYKRAGPFRRYFARTFDLSLEMLIIGAAIIATIPDIVIPLLGKDPTGLGFIVAWFALALILDAIIYALFGNTPGKALLGIRIHENPGTKEIDEEKYSSRNFSFLFSGIGLGIPLLSQIVSIYQFLKVISGKPTTYDSAGGFMVYYKPAGFLRHLVFIAIFIGMGFPWAFSGLILNAHEQKFPRTATQSKIESSPQPVIDYYNTAQNEPNDPSIQPDINGEVWNFYKDNSDFKKNIYEAIKGGPNFAGHYAIVGFSVPQSSACERKCNQVVLLNLKNGKISYVPVYINSPYVDRRYTYETGERWTENYSVDSGVIESWWCAYLDAGRHKTIEVHQNLVYKNGEFINSSPIIPGNSSCQ